VAVSSVICGATDPGAQSAKLSLALTQSNVTDNN